MSHTNNKPCIVCERRWLREHLYLFFGVALDGLRRDRQLKRKSIQARTWSLLGLPAQPSMFISQTLYSLSYGCCLRRPSAQLVNNGICFCAKPRSWEIFCAIKSSPTCGTRTTCAAQSIGKPSFTSSNALNYRLHLGRSKRGKDFDFDTWEAMCEAAMAGEHAPSALEGEIALHAQTRDALIAVRKERDALLVDTCRGASCGKCLCCRAKQPAHDDLEYAQDEAVFELDNTEP